MNVLPPLNLAYVVNALPLKVEIDVAVALATDEDAGKVSVTAFTEELKDVIELAVAVATLADVGNVSVTAFTEELKDVIDVAVALATDELTANPLAAIDADKAV